MSISVPPTKTKREVAAELLRELFDSSSRVAISVAVAAGSERGVSRRTLARVGSEMGVRTIQGGRGNGGIWERTAQ